MARIYLTLFLVVAIVALTGITISMQAEKSGSAVAAPRCFTYALEIDNVVRNTLGRIWDERGYEAQEATWYDACTGEEAPGVAVYYNQNPPLRDYHRFEWFNEDVFGYMGGPEPKVGYIQYTICADERAEVVMSGVKLCSTL